MPKYCCSWSGGKDSTASIILAHEHNEPLDTIIFSEVMFDLKNNISGEDPDHIKFIYETAKPLFESWGYEVKILRADTDYLDFFNHTVTKGPGKGKKHGFPLNGRCGIKRECKLPPIKAFYKSLEDEEVYTYVGIAIDEPARLNSLHKDKYNISLLEKYSLTEQGAYNMCEKFGLLSPIYTGLGNKRGGCWFCPNAKCSEHRKLRTENPDLWYQFVELENEDNLHYSKFNCYSNYGELKRREEQFKWEDNQLSIFDIAFSDIFKIS